MPVEGGIDPGRDRELPTPCEVDATSTAAVLTGSGIDAPQNQDDACPTGSDPGPHRDDAPWGRAGPMRGRELPTPGQDDPTRDQDGATPGSGRPWIKPKVIWAKSGFALR
jgi:hypothetical protein